MSFLTSIPSLYSLYSNDGGFDEKVEILLHKRQIRNCAGPGEVKAGLFHLSLGLTILLFCIAILLLLICLGIMKGIVGVLCNHKIGMFGMNVLIDLPRPMKRYQEAELKEMDVVYDAGGWPVHPQTGQRIVRPISKNTEFCMNVVFFLTYPFVILIKLCSLCCYKSYDEEGMDNNIYDNVNTVVFSECPRSQVKECKDKTRLCKGSCVQKDIYKDEDSAEEADTKYVLQQMHESQERLHQ